MEEYQENLDKYLAVQSLHVDYQEFNMNYIKRVIVTTNGIIYKPAEPEVSNRVIRRYQEYVKYFIRVK